MSRKIKGFVSILWNIRSAYNVGSIFRTADACGLEKLFLTGITPTPSKVKKQWSLHTKKAIEKVALGAEKFVDWEYYYRITPLIKKLKRDGYKIVAFEQNQNSISLFKWKPSLPLAMVFGNETKGLSKNILILADEIVEIPMLGEKESLNVSISFAIAGYYFLNTLRYSVDVL